LILPRPSGLTVSIRRPICATESRGIVPDPWWSKKELAAVIPSFLDQGLELPRLKADGAGRRLEQ
jgi:hypothetical protein